MIHCCDESAFRFVATLTVQLFLKLIMAKGLSIRALALFVLVKCCQTLTFTSLTRQHESWRQFAPFLSF